ncbi:MAG: hypothetical protein Q9218_005331 [Villophora microphyllina]
MTEKKQHSVRSRAKSANAEPGAPYQPTDRADADRKVSTEPQKRDRKWKDGKKLRKKNSQGILEFVVTVVDAQYDEIKHQWMYELKDYQDLPIEGLTKETDLE